MSTETLIYDIASNDNAESRQVQSYEHIVENFVSRESTNTLSADGKDLSESIHVPLEQIKLHPLIHLPSNRTLSKEKLIQEWAGIVLDYEEGRDFFRARLSDKTNPLNSDEEADIILSDIPQEDLNLITPGAEFSWYIYYEEGKRITKRRSSKIKFRRLAHWKKTDINNAKQKETELLEFFRRD